MEIIRAKIDDDDIFSEGELSFGACCFYSKDKKFKYFFQIKGYEATLYTNTNQHIRQAIKEFLFYSNFITVVKSESGEILETRTQSEPYLHPLSEIQPSQFYISEKKLKNCKKWITKPEDIIIPVTIKDGTIISLDGHTRMRAALDLGYNSVYVYQDECDEYIFRFVDEAIKRRIRSVFNMAVISHEDYEIKWNKFCDEFLRD